jgi:hypothetical protein
LHPRPRLGPKLVNLDLMRFYDLQDNLVDSLDFRFAAGLQQLAVQQVAPLPAEAGHGVLFTHIDEYELAWLY